METLAPVDLDIAEIHRVIESEGACIAWGGALGLSPADDICEIAQIRVATHKTHHTIAATRQTEARKFLASLS